MTAPESPHRLPSVLMMHLLVITHSVSSFWHTGSTPLGILDVIQPARYLILYLYFWMWWNGYLSTSRSVVEPYQYRHRKASKKYFAIQLNDAFDLLIAKGQIYKIHKLPNWMTLNMHDMTFSLDRKMILYKDDSLCDHITWQNKQWQASWDPYASPISWDIASPTAMSSCYTNPL